MAQESTRRYKIFFTPLLNVDTNLYGAEIDVSNRIEISGIGNIKKSIDSADYDFGIFAFSDLALKGYNLNGYFNDENDQRSIFPVTRDRCKVRVVLEEVTIYRDNLNRIIDTSVVQTSTFYGLVNEEATRLDAVTDQIQFKVLSRDSVLRTTKIPAGVINNGTLCKAAMESILNNPAITALLNFSASNINPDLNFTIDVGAEFDNKTVKDGIDLLLVASNSVFTIDDSMNMIVKNRVEDQTRPIVLLYGKSDKHARENIITITAYNAGKHRMFTAVKVNNTERSNQTYVSTFGYRLKSIEMPFITNPITEILIADNLMNEFKAPKIELSVQVSTKIAKSMRLLDRVSIAYPLRVKPPNPGQFLPEYGSAVYGDPVTPYPNTYGAISIPRNFAFKVIEIEDNAKELTSIVRLRQLGTDIDDGIFNLPANAIYGFGLYGEAKYRFRESNDFNPSVYGAGRFGSTEYGT